MQGTSYRNWQRIVNTLYDDFTPAWETRPIGLELANMNHRHLGQNGHVVSETSYGDWITHASQSEKHATIV